MVMEGGNVSFDNNDSTSSSEANISLTSNSEMYVPGKLHVDIISLKTEYLRIINSLDVKLSDDNNTTTIELLTDEQLKAAMGKLLKPTLFDHLCVLMTHIRNICLPKYEKDTRPKLIPQNTKLDNIVDKVENLTSASNINFESIKKDLDCLQTLISNIKDSNVHLNSDSHDIIHSVNSVSNPDQAEIITEHNQVHIENNKTIENFVDSDKCNKMLDKLKELQLTKSRGRSTLSFGESYKFNGSRNDPVEFPECIKELMDTLNENFCDGSAKLNSCLLTRYDGPESYIPGHSDNERCIHAQSDIFTISLGHQCTLKFTDTLTGNECTHEAQNGSLYTMSRKSQDIFKHRIDQDDSWTDSDFRISLTFRSVHWKNHNSTIIMGDSNTAHLKFDSCGASFGSSMPGEQVFAYTLDELDPLKCLGYNNIVIHCGLNDIRHPEIKTEKQIRSKYVEFKTKIVNILHFNKRASIFIVPILPSKLANVNRKALFFNHLIRSDLADQNRAVSVVLGVADFVDNFGSLSKQYSLREGDNLHLNMGGTRLLAKIIKTSIFSRKRERQQSRLYAGVLKGGSRQVRGPPSR